MEAKELRIGNYVQPFIDGCETTLVIPNDFKNTTYLRPIPLTEDWLLRFGFEEKDSRKNRFINRADFELEFQGDKVAYCVWGGEDAPHLTQFFGHCKYVHQLQNLYFALTNEELIIKQ
jgi:hypothetical protein